MASVRYRFLWPVVLAVGTAAALYALGVRVWSSGICFALCAFVFATIGQEFIRGAQVRRGATGTDIFTSPFAFLSSDTSVSTGMPTFSRSCSPRREGAMSADETITSFFASSRSFSIR